MGTDFPSIVLESFQLVNIKMSSRGFVFIVPIIVFPDLVSADKNSRSESVKIHDWKGIFN